MLQDVASVQGKSGSVHYQRPVYINHGVPLWTLSPGLTTTRPSTNVPGHLEDHDLWFSTPYGSRSFAERGDAFYIPVEYILAQP